MTDVLPRIVSAARSAATSAARSASKRSRWRPRWTTSNSDGASPSRMDRPANWGTGGLRLHAALAAIVYIPLLLTRPGWISADTKTYLYLDPAKLMSRSWSMWDPSVGMGTVTHQNIGYLWPMGPFYWVMEQVGVPDWMAQRLWWGTILFIAGAGVAYLLRTLAWRGPGITAAVFIYALTPYVLTLVARLSGLLLPFAVLPWLVALTIQSVRHRGWRHPAMFALAVATFGSVNATALVLVGAAPVLWLAHAVWGTRETTVRQATIAALKMGGLAVLTSAWWIAGLSVQSTNGIEILRYTETAETVAKVSVAHELLRGLGYWFFYGGDRLGPWIEPSVSYTQWLPLIALTYLLPLLGLLGAVISRWRHRAYFILLLLLGLLLAVGAHPWGGGPLVSRAFEALLTSDTGMAMRSLPRAVPLVVLALAVLAGSGLTSLARRWPRVRRYGGLTVALLAVLALPTLWLGDFVPDNLRRQEDVPDYWDEAAAYVDEQGSDTRVLVVPGADFASYRWGNTVDPLLPGLVDRPSVQRELIPYGSPASANLLNAFDLRLQERTADPQSVAAVARLMRAGDILVQSDLQYERYNTPRPENFWAFMLQAGGLGEPVTFGPGEPNVTIDDVQLYDELFLTTDPNLEDPPEVGIFPVENAVPIVTAQSPHHEVLVAGDGAGLVDAATLGLIDGTELIRYSASLSEDEIGAALENDAALVLTDSNRKRGERWNTVRHTRGYTESADGGVLEEDLSDNRLPMFPDAGTDTQTITVNRSGIDARATTYGNEITYTPEERPANAIDDNPYTAWRTAAFNDARGERLEVTHAEPVTTDNITLHQPITGAITRYITEVRLRFDGGDAVDVTLNDRSRGYSGQVITFPERTFSSLSIEILADSAGDLPRFVGESSVGFSEVEIGNDMPAIDEMIRLPTDLLDAAGAESLDHPLAITLNRQRQDATDVTRNDEEHGLNRLFTLPTERDFTLNGLATISPRSEPETRDALLGRSHDGSVPWARSSSNLTGDISTASAAFDGDPATTWTSIRSRPQNQWIEAVLPEETTIDQVPLSVVADGYHSVPTEMELWVDGELVGTVPVPEIEDGDERGDTTTVELEIPEVTGSQFRFKFTEVRTVTTNDWVADEPVAQPTAIAEVGLPDLTVPDLADTFDSGCRDDLVTVNDEPVPVRISGPMEAALAGQPLSVSTCGGADVSLDGGEQILRTVSDLDSGVAINQLMLRSAAGGEPAPVGPTLASEASAGDDDPNGPTAAVPDIEVVSEGHDHVTVQVDGAQTSSPFWLTLGQSYNEGWEATLEDGTSLGEPDLVNGMANGWLVSPTSESFTVTMRFAPQQRVNLALGVSVIAGLACIGLAFRRPRPAYAAPSALPEPYSPVLAFRYQGALPSRGIAVLAGVAIGTAAWLTAGLLVGLVTGVAAGVAARHEKFRRWLILGAPLMLALSAAYVMYLQTRWNLMPSFDWPIEVRRAHPAGWLAVWLLAADVMISRLWQARSTEHPD